ncbi:MAG: hypothetical protein J7K73_03020 [Nanoarchaeota archaeon]|nr:hypothetical protein [Nanoarchaeota archaeon]
MVFDKKTILERYEDQFKVREMKNKHLFHDLYARVGDPEELRGFIVELLQDSDWKTSINELTRFEDEEMEPVFRGGRLKPIRSIIKAYKQIKKGPKYPLIWKLLFLIGAGFLGAYLYTLAVPTNWNSNLILEVTPIWFILALIVYSIKETVSLAMWIKISGVYDIEDGNADVRVVLAADADKKDKEAYDKLEEDVSEIYNVLNRKYVPKKKVTKTEIVKVLKPKKKQPELSLMKTVRDIDKQLATLNKRFINKEISEETYKELKRELEKRKAKAETVLDLLSI